jgi:uncharacterized protein (DUF58 family)
MTTTGRSTFLFALIFALLLFGLATLNGSVIALSIPLLVYLGAGVLQQPEVPRLSIRRVLSAERADVDTPVTVIVTATNEGAPLREISIQDALPSGLTVIEGETHALAALDRGQSLTLEYVVSGRRGEHRFVFARVMADDGFGLLRYREDRPLPGTLRVLPESQRLRSIAIRPPRTRGFAGPIPSRQGGSGVDFFSLREYQIGDRLRAINWRVTARASARAAVQVRQDQNVYTNVFEQERIADVGIILDARVQSDLRTAHGALFEHSVRAAASLSETFLGDGNRVGLLVYGGGISSVFPGYGHVQRERILNALSRAAPGHHFVFENLRNLPTRFFPAQSQIVFVGPVMNGDVSTFTRLLANGYALMVVSPNPILFEMQSRKPGAVEPQADLALRAAQAERLVNIQQMRRRSIQVVDWDVNQPLDAVLHEALARQPVQVRALAPGARR